MSDDVAGRATGAGTLDELIRKPKMVIPELLEANGLLQPDRQGGTTFAMIAARRETAPRAA
jgi:Domain of unknown function (DUF1902)